MSGTNKAAANPAKPASLTPAEAQEWASVLKQIEDNPWVLRAVLAAGLAGLFEIVHLLFLALRFLVHWGQGTWSF